MSLLHQAAQAEEATSVTDTMGLLLHQIAYQHGLIAQLLTSMSAEADNAASISNADCHSETWGSGHHTVCLEQLIALQLLADELECAETDR